MDWSFVDYHRTRSYNHTNLLSYRQSDLQVLAVSVRRFTRGDLLLFHFTSAQSSIPLNWLLKPYFTTRYLQYKTDSVLHSRKICDIFGRKSNFL